MRRGVAGVVPLPDLPADPGLYDHPPLVVAALVLVGVLMCVFVAVALRVVFTHRVSRTTWKVLLASCGTAALLFGVALVAMETGRSRAEDALLEWNSLSLDARERAAEQLERAYGIQFIEPAMLPLEDGDAPRSNVVRLPDGSEDVCHMGTRAGAYTVACGSEVPDEATPLPLVDE